MAQEGGADLRGLLEQDRQSVLEFLELARKLVFDVQASHYWSEHTVEYFKQIEQIGHNMTTLLEALEPHWEEGKRIFNRPEAAKLWKTSTGLLGALGPIRVKYVEMLDRRRRQRIMGQDYDELPEITPEISEEGIDNVRRMHAQLLVTFESLLPLINTVPPGITPAIGHTATPASANGTHAPTVDAGDVPKEG
ncbi:MAG: hypothetical protein M3R04_05570 [bacterium]|nr:hypothetical protein [bacterium]